MCHLPTMTLTRLHSSLLASRYSLRPPDGGTLPHTPDRVAASLGTLSCREPSCCTVSRLSQPVPPAPVLLAGHEPGGAERTDQAASTRVPSRVDACNRFAGAAHHTMWCDALPNLPVSVLLVFPFYGRRHVRP